VGVVDEGFLSDIFLRAGGTRKKVGFFSLCSTQPGDYKVTSTGDQPSAFCKAAWMISARLTGVWALKVPVEPVEEVAAVPGDCES